MSCLSKKLSESQNDYSPSFQIVYTLLENDRLKYSLSVIGVVMQRKKRTFAS